MKYQTDVEYVRLAISKDKTRPNVGEAYYDGKRVIATDGKRVHISHEGQGPTWPVGYLDHRDEQFPDWEVAVKLHQSGYWIKFRTSSDLIKRLTALAKVYSKTRVEEIARFEINSNELTITMASEFPTTSAKVQIATEFVTGPFEAVAHINLKYFAEALTYGDITMRIEPDTQEKYSIKPIEIHNEDRMLIAIVAACRAPGK